MDKLLVVGFGRMGITHLAISNLLQNERLAIVILEESLLMRLFIRRSFGIRVVKNLRRQDVEDAVVIVSTPPFSHKSIVSRCLNFNPKKIFVEKPYGTFTDEVLINPKVFVGYVLRKNDVVLELKKYVQRNTIRELNICYHTSTMKSKPKGWRNTEYSGVLNELGSHILDMTNFILGNLKDSKIVKFHSNSIVSDVDDELFLVLDINGVKVSIELNWCKSEVRKPIWFGSITSSSGEVVNFDQQRFNGTLVYSEADVYVRGREFSNQLKSLFAEDTDLCTSAEAEEVNNLIKNLKNLTR